MPPCVVLTIAYLRIIVKGYFVIFYRISVPISATLCISPKQAHLSTTHTHCPQNAPFPQNCATCKDKTAVYIVLLLLAIFDMIILSDNYPVRKDMLMKKTFYILLAAIVLIGALAACSSKNKENTISPTSSGLVDNIFDPVSDSAQDPTKETATQNSTNPSQNQQSSGNSQSAGGQQSSSAVQSTEPVVLNPTDPAAPTTNPTVPTTNSTAPTTAPTSPAEEPTESTEPENTLAAEYEAYKAMNATEKKKFRETFDTTADFFKWYNAALKAHKEANPATPIPPDGNITLN